MSKFFKKESDLCSSFIESLPSKWTSYNETHGFDMLLVHESGFQIAVEAKLTLNSKVLSQIINTRETYYFSEGPDFRAVLVDHCVSDNLPLARALGITVLTLSKSSEEKYDIRPHLPEFDKPENIMKNNWFFNNGDWFDEFPNKRLKLPEYVPDVKAGNPSPTVMGDWKIQAMKICVWISKNKIITRRQFAQFRVNPTRWMNGLWLKKGINRGEWLAGEYFPAQEFKRQHPIVYQKIIDDYEIWSEKIEKVEIKNV